MEFLKGFWYEKTGFQNYSLEHFIIIFLAIATGTYLIWRGRQLDEKGKTQLGLKLAWTVAGFELFWLFHKLQTGAFSPENLPFDLCNVCALTIPFALSRRWSWMEQIIYFWVMAGTLQGVLTPDLQSAFPYIGYVKFWVVHCGLVMSVIYGVAVYRWRPNLKGLLLSFVAINIYAAMVYPINSALGTNFGYIMHKPVGGSILDLLGDNYVLKLEVLVPFVFLIFWLPIFIYSKIKKEA
jgi:hypothetical integral membrane protein (TIGR02206 family)